MAKELTESRRTRYTRKAMQDALIDLMRERPLGSITIKALCEQAVAANPNAVSDYLGGKEKALKALVGFVMKATRGTADSAAAEKKLIELVRR